MNNAKTNIAVVGLGITGYSCVRFFVKHDFNVLVTDSRANPPFAEELQKLYPNVKTSFGKLDEKLLLSANEIILSPGLPQNLPELIVCSQKNIPIIGDIELFARVARAPIIAVTGSNAKSTVVKMLEEIALNANLKVAMGGNFGVPALDLLSSEEPDLYILELSSFQLETTYSLKPEVAAILNISPDHMDRYHSFADYVGAKQRIYDYAKNIVYNRDDRFTYPQSHPHAKQLNFGTSDPGENEFGLRRKAGKTYLAYQDQNLCLTDELYIKGEHNYLNALAALAMGHALNISLDSMIVALKKFKGLPHRCENVAEKNQVCWYNDSKGTNIGATQAAINGLANDITGKIVLILGGQAKGADFSELIPMIQKHVREIILLGEDADKIEKALKGKAPITRVDSMQDAIKASGKAAKPNDIVLLSPACASYDMFDNYQHRGDVFKQLVKDFLK